MKQKLLFILVGILCSLGTWADSLCSYEFSNSGLSATSGSSDGTNCSVTWSSLGATSTSSNCTVLNQVAYWKLTSNDAYVKITLTDDSFIAGDELTIDAYMNSTSQGKGFYIKSQSGNKIAQTGTKAAQTFTYTLTPNDINEDGSITLYRIDSNSYIHGISVSGTRTAGPKDPTATFSNSSYEIGSTLDLSTLFSSNSTGTVSYSITNANGTGATLDADGKTFSATTAGTATVQASQAAVTGSFNAITKTATINVTTPVVYTGTLIKAVFATSTTATVTGNMTGATADVNLSSSGKMDKGKYFGVKAADGQTFKTGDIVNIHFTAKGSKNEWYVFNSSTASDATLVYSSTTGGTNTDLSFKLASDQTALYLVRDGGGAAPYGLWNPTFGYIEVKRPESIQLGGIKVADETLDATKYTIEGNTITLVDKYSLAPTVSLIENTVFSSTDKESADITVTLGDASAGYFTGTATVGGETYTVKVPVDNSPVLSLSTESANVTVPSYGVVAEKTTLAGKNLTDGTYTIAVNGNITVNPTTFTVASGSVNLEFTISAAETAENATATFTVGSLSKVFTLNATKTTKRDITEATAVSEATTWDWSKAGTNAVQLSTSTSPSNTDEFILGTLSEITNDANFNSASLTVKNADWPNRIESNNQFGQLATIKFTTTVPGTIKVVFSNTGGSRPYRYLNVNGENTDYKDNAGTKITSGEIYVPAGEVIICGHFTTNTSEIVDNGNGTSTLEGGTADAYKIDNTLLDAAQYLRIYSVTFTPAIICNISDAKYGTFSASVATTIPEGITAYATSKNDESVTLTAITDGIVPANTGVIVYSETSGNYTFTKASSAGTATSILTANLAESQIASTDYVLGNGTKGVGFYHLTSGNKLGANKAYLKASNMSGAKSFISFSFDEATGISEVNDNEVSSNSNCYNLAGQHVNANSKGIVIVNGKKYINK